jgi:hypothetical protein
MMVYARSLTPAEITLPLQASAMYMASMREPEAEEWIGVPAPGLA